ncbi:MAG: DUF3052 family protein [Thermoanaerobaculia bacterium]
MKSAGYSGTPLPKKLGLVPPMTFLVVGAPPEYRTWLGELPPRIRLVSSAKGTLAAVHLFVTKRADLKEQLTALRGRIDQSGFVWVSWPKKASKVPTEVTEDTIREIALPLGFVDVKVCAVSDVWSGLKLVIRKELRQA